MSTSSKILINVQAALLTGLIISLFCHGAADIEVQIRQVENVLYTSTRLDDMLWGQFESIATDLGTKEVRRMAVSVKIMQLLV